MKYMEVGYSMDRLVEASSMLLEKLCIYIGIIRLTTSM